MSPSIAASIVTFNPSLPTLAALVNRLKPQVDVIFLVDNGSSPELVEHMAMLQDDSRVVLELLKENCGVATAHNVALEKAKHQGCTHIVMFDQDSLPSDAMVRELLCVELDLFGKGAKVAAVGPQYFDPRHLRPAPFIRLEKGMVRKLHCDADVGVVPVDYLITSGTLIRLEVVSAVGKMDDSLFIDYIDIEWCLRAKAMGYQSFGVCAAKMQHALGDEVISWRNGKRLVSVRSPLRNYYLFRNAVLLYRRRYISWVWALNDAYRLLLKLGFFSLVTPPRLTNLKMMLLGLLHGVQGRSGRYQK